MAKYRLINKSCLSSSFWVVNKIYDSDLQRDPDWNSVQDMANKYPNNWELIKEKSPRELLLEEAKLKYPIGTKFMPILRSSGGYETISKDPYITASGEFIQDGPGGFNIYMKRDNKWAKIKEEPMCVEKTIIGYKLKDNLWENDFRKQSFIKGVCSIGVIHGDITIENIEKSTNPRHPAVLDNFKAAGVLDLWFQPVYKSEFPDITINGYKGEFFDNYVKFGCAEIHKQIFLSFDKLNARIKDGDDPIGAKTNKEIELVTIGRGLFTKDQIKEIAEYYLNK